jgi:Holliday junction resolvase RusA-like endonuclease
MTIANPSHFVLPGGTVMTEHRSDAISFTVPGVFPSLNVLNKWHWAKRARLRKSIAWQILAALPDRTKLMQPEKHVMIVDIVIYQPHRRLDQDNAEGEMKAFVDSLRSLGLIFRDSPKWLKKTIEQEIDRKNPRVEISIKEFEATP